MGGGPSESFHTFESYYRYRFILLSRMFLRFFLCLAILTVSCGFTLNGYSRFSTRVSMSETDLEIAPTMEAVEEESVAVPAPPAPKPQLKAKWLPVGNMMAPKMLDGSLAGDVGFDPLGISKSKKTLYWMREAEVKHARLAMLAAAGWPLSELWHKEIAQTFGFPSILANGDKAPSLLNGGLSSPFVSGILVTSILVAGLLEGKAMNDGAVFWGNDKPEGYVPGDLKFDPLNLYKIRGDKKVMQTMEIKNGRLAMLAITGFAFSEAISGLPVVQQTPFLF